MITDKLQKLGQREKVMLWLAGIVILLLLIDKLTMQPVVDAMKWCNSSIKQEEKDLNYNLSVLCKDEEVSAAYAKVEGLLDEAKSRGTATDEIKAQIDLLASATGLMINSMEPRAPVVSKFYDTYAVEIGSFEAQPENLLTFLHRLHKAPGMLRMASLVLEMQSEEQRIKGSMQITKVMVRPSAI
ncbi:MAG: hypothetical protein QGH15_07080 [Kiritimatiellia bacterium]|jgi:hypothetical protein|nr:hypothetical protein [Kiritimatiellia bacterium]